MEIILDILTERRANHIEWKQITRAIILALIFAGLYSYISGYADNMKEHLKDHAAPVGQYVRFEELGNVKPLLEELFEGDKSRVSPVILSANQDNMLCDKSIAKQIIEKKSETSGDEKARERDAENISVSEPDTIIPDSESDITIDTEQSVKNEIENTEDTEKTIVLSVELYGNGGVPEVITDSCAPNQFTVENYEAPKRMGKLFDGWFCDKECTVPFTVVLADQTSLKLYAGWKEFPGFISNDNGYITGYTDPSKFMKDNLIVFPTYDTCIGIEKNALKGLENEIYEIYIPKNISYIAHGSFDYLTDLIYIEAALGNSEYYSESGVLYYKNGEVAACPELLKTE